MPRSLIRLAALAVGLLVAASASAQPILYVDADATGADDGTSWANAFEELDDALDAATAGTQIWVAEGVYRPTDDPVRTETFRLKTGVAVLGGFDGTETSADDRTEDPDEGGTVLSGDIGVAGDASDNVYHVVSAINVDATAVLDGFLITGGAADGALPDDRGAGLLALAASPTLRNVLFEGNTARFGGGMFVSGSSVVSLEDVEFKENAATVGGGGLYADGTVDGDGVEFEENVSGERGAAMFASVQSVVVLRDVEFDSNVVGEPGQAAPARGGGVHSQNEASVTLIDAEFERNVANGGFGDGAGINAQGGAVAVVNGVFTGNRSRLGPAVTTRNGSPSVELVNVVVAGNQSAEDNGGALFFSEATAATLSGLTVSGNDGQAAIRAVGTAQVEVFNAIVWDNDAPSLVAEGSATFSVDHAVIEGGFPGGEAVLAADPLFFRAPDDGPDDEWGTEDDDYGDLRLMPASPAQGFGDLGLVPEDAFDLDDDGVTGELLPLDLDGEARVQDGSVELGAYEGADAFVSGEVAASPAALGLSPARPNPSHRVARLTLTLARAADVEVGLYDLLGRRVARLADGPAAAGALDLVVPVAGLAPGLYVVRARTADGVATRRLTVVR